MTDRPILMSAPMVRALLEGRKTQTRRLAWKGKEFRTREQFADDYIGSRFVVTRIGNGLISVRHPTIWQKVRPGDRLWVREAWGAWPSLMGGVVRDTLAYRADNPPVGNPNWRWRPSIHMPRWASRITLLVTKTRMERVQEITDRDAVQEGIMSVGGGRYWLGAIGQRPRPFPVNAYKDLWTKLHGPDSWQSNPEVVALTFEVRQCNIDTLEAA